MSASAFLFFIFALCYDTVCCYCCVPVSHRKLLTFWQPWHNSSRTHKIFFFVTAANGASVCARVRIMWACHPEHNETISTHTSSQLQKHPRSTAAVQHQRTWQDSYTYGRNACVPSFQFATPPGFRVDHTPKGNLEHCTYCTCVYIMSGNSTLQTHVSAHHTRILLGSTALKSCF